MAVTKIRRISSWLLLLCTIISLTVIVLFFFGGDHELYKGEMWNPIYMDLMLYWQYILLAVTIVVALIFAIWQFGTKFKNNPKSALMGLAVLVLFAAMLFITYTMGDPTPVPVVNSESQAFNTTFWLKFSDMWLYSTYIMLGLCILAVCGGSVKKILKK